MPYVIQAPALAIMDLLQLREQGKMPDLLADEAVLSIDFGELVKARRGVIVNDINGVAGGNTFQTTNNLTVPVGEAWWIQNVSMRGTANAAGTNIVTMRAQQDGVALDLDDVQAPAVSVYVSRVMKAQPFWLRSGGALGFGNEGTSLATMAISALVTKFRSGA